MSFVGPVGLLCYFIAYKLYSRLLLRRRSDFPALFRALQVAWLVGLFYWFVMPSCVIGVAPLVPANDRDLAAMPLNTTSEQWNELMWAWLGAHGRPRLLFSNPLSPTLSYPAVVVKLTVPTADVTLSKWTLDYYYTLGTGQLDTSCDVADDSMTYPARNVSFQTCHSGPWCLRQWSRPWMVPAVRGYCCWYSRCLRLTS